jgi:molecular chaperone DnaK
VQVSFDIDANGLLQVSAMDRTTGRQQSVSIQGGSNLTAEEIEALIEEAEQKAAEDRRKRAAIDRRNKAQTLVGQAERRLRDAALELGPYGAERQQRAVEMAVRDVQDLLALEERGDSDPGELDLAVSQLQEALFGLNRRILSERRAEQGPLQGLKNTLGSLKDELFADDDAWDDWSRPGSDPWAMPPAGGSFGGDRFGSGRYGSERSSQDRDQRDPYDRVRYDREPYGRDRDDRDLYEPERFDSGLSGAARFGSERFDARRDASGTDPLDRVPSGLASSDRFQSDRPQSDRPRPERYRSDDDDAGQELDRFAESRYEQSPRSRSRRQPASVPGDDPWDAV